MSTKKKRNSRISTHEEVVGAPVQLEPCTQKPERVEFELIIEEQKPERVEFELIIEEQKPEPTPWVDVVPQFAAEDGDTSEPEEGGAS